MNFLNINGSNPISPEFEELFKEEIDAYNGPLIHINLPENAVPKFVKARAVPFALRELVDKKLKSLEEQGIIEPIKFSKWASPIVTVLKNDGTIRICHDYKTTVNLYTNPDKYPLPTIPQLLDRLRGGKVFTKLDMAQAYQQLKVDDESSEILTINTPRGLYRVKRLPFGLNSAVGTFQRFMDTLLSGIDGVAVYLDDVLIAGSNFEDLKNKTEKVLLRFKEAGLRLKRDKCKFFVSEIDFLGLKIDYRGVHPSDEKLRAIKDARPPCVLDRLRFLPIKKNGSKNLYKFCVKNEIKCADAFRMLTVAYGEATLDRSNVYRWYKMFSEGREDVNDEERAGRPSTSTTDEKINEVEKMILTNRRITVREVAEDLSISIGSCHSIFINDLGMRRVAAKFVPKLLNCDQKQHRMNIANEMLDSVRDDPNLLQRVITGDKAWVYGYDVETKAQSSQWKLPHEPRPKKARQVRSNVKVLLTVFSDFRGVVHREFLPRGRTVNKENYLQVMRNFREAIRQKRPDLWKNKNWLLHHDNAPAHTSLLVRDFLAKNNTLMMPKPPYSPDLAPCDFFLFPKLKRPMKGRRYSTLDEIKTASKEELKKKKKIFLKCFEDWKNRWHKCIISHGDYFEGDKIEASHYALCIDDLDCIQDLECSEHTCLCPVDKIWNGSICKPKEGHNELCIDNQDCIQDLECSENMCICPVDKIWNGSICILKAGFKESCWIDSDCKSGLECSSWKCECPNGQGWDGVKCQKELDYGEYCTYDSECKSGLKCYVVCSCPRDKAWTGFDCKKEVGYKEYCDEITICKNNLKCTKNICQCSKNEVWKGYYCNSDYNGYCTSNMDCIRPLLCYYNRCRCSSSLAIYIGNSCVVASPKIDLLTNSNYAIWSMKIEALLDSRDIFDDVINNPKPTKDDKNGDAFNEWTKKNKQALGIIILSLSSDQAIAYKGIKNAQELWNAIKLRYEGEAEDKSMNLMLELTRLKKKYDESIEGYLTRCQGISRQLIEMGKAITDKEIIRYILEGLPDKYNNVITSILANRNMDFNGMRQNLLDFEKRNPERRQEHVKVYKTSSNQNKVKTCFCCGKTGHFQKDCWFKNRNKVDHQKTKQFPTKRFTKNHEEKANITKEHIPNKDKQEFALTAGIEQRKIVNEWQLDSACTSHMSCDNSWMINEKDEVRQVNFAKTGRSINSISRGDIKAVTELDDGQHNNVKLEDVLFVPQLNGNLMSVPSLVKRGNSVTLNQEGAFIYAPDGQLICKGEFEEDMFTISLIHELRQVDSKEKCFKIDKDSRILWHKRLGHINDDYMSRMKRDGMVRGLPDLRGEVGICQACITGKMPRTPFQATYDETAKGTLECLHVDLCGPMKEESLSGNKYMMAAVDQYSRKYFVNFLSFKDEVSNKLKDLINSMENELDKKVKRIRTDNGFEFINRSLEEYFKTKGIKHEKTCNYSPRSNGIAERANRTLLDKARTLLSDGGLPVQFWAEAISTAEYLHNITPNKTQKQETPMELWNGQKPTVKHLKVFGCLAFYKVNANQRHKLQPKAAKGIFIGYSRERKAYRIYDANQCRLHETRDVKFDESKKGIEESHGCIEPLTDNLDYLPLDFEITDSPEMTFAPQHFEGDNSDYPNEENLMINQGEETGSLPEETPPDNRRPVRERKMPIKYNDHIVYQAHEEEIPNNYEETLNSNDKDLWYQAMLDELSSMRIHNVWEIVDRPKYQKIIKSNWVYSIKDTPDNVEPTYKARLVAVGYNQKQGLDYDESFSPVMKMGTFRTLLSLATINKYKIRIFDIKTAYLNGTLERPIYMEMPPGFTEKDKVLLVNKSIYGLPQSGRCWNQKFDEILKNINLKRLISDPCVYFKEERDAYLCIGIYVDDIIVIASSEQLIDDFQTQISKFLTVRKVTSNTFLGIEILVKDEDITLSQYIYIDKILDKFKMSDCNASFVPGTVGENLDDFKDSKKFSPQIYQEAIGSLMYLSTGTRPDLAYAISNLSQYCKEPYEIHWKALKKVLRYVKGTRNVCLKLTSKMGHLTAFTDASWNNTADAKSFGGHIIKIGDNLLNWKSGKQRIVALSTMEAELLSFCDGVCDIKFYTSLLEELNMKQLIKEPTPIKTDSKSLIDWIKNQKQNTRRRHFNRKYHFIKDEYVKKTI
ncbi:hypothetical protein LAZ67_1000919 [Cordylochernes scorpioides]|uniref:Retrovirus-related Pol polyprotein from transposon TNT 1-94 n=1 Tax=Cordylochernes scorpioides TaxID=51811 RepID=A0ABY6JVT2_9ARAC|nr:hypothetical protein LAZ67_1000919 [Cordylochernes scorpioides]